MPNKTAPNIGARIREIRDQQGLSLRVLSEMCSLSINAISRIERGENSPTVSTLHKLTSALNVAIKDLFLGEEETELMYLKDGKGDLLKTGAIAFESLGSGILNRMLDPFKVYLEPGAEMEDKAVSHPGEEFVTCIQGEAKYTIGDTDYPLKKGDSILFNSAQPHSWRNESESVTKLIMIFYSPEHKHLATKRHIK